VGANPEIDVPGKMFELNRLSSLVSMYKQTKVYPWLNTNRLSQEIRDFLQDFLSVFLDISYTLSDDVVPWLDVNVNTETAESSTFSCIFCKRFTDNSSRYDRPSSSLIKALMTEQGYRLRTGPKAKTFNKSHFKGHIFSRVHMDAVNWLREQV